MGDVATAQVRPKDVLRFFKRVRITGPLSCWPWKGRLDRYGTFKIFGMDTKAHRAAYMMMRGPIPRGLLVRHTCDNRGCVNPQHLVLGTHQDNSDDLVARGKAGRPVPLSEDECLALHARYEARICSAREFAKHEGVSRRSLYRYVKMARKRLAGRPWDDIKVSGS